MLKQLNQEVENEAQRAPRMTLDIGTSKHHKQKPGMLGEPLLLPVEEERKDELA